MPKGLILLVLLLLIGGYFVFTALGGGSTVVSTPYIDATAKVVQGNEGYTAVLDGSVKLPGEKKYTIQSLSVSLLINGVPVQSKNLVDSPTDIEGPSQYPISFSPNFAPSAENVAIRVEGNVASGKDVYVLSSTIPVALPDKTTLAKSPSVGVSLSSVKLLGPTKSLTVNVSLYNPNDAKMDFDSLTLTYGSSSYDLEIDSIAAKKTATASVSLSVPKDVTAVSITINGSYTVNGVSKTITRSFDLNVPSLSEQPLIFDVKAKTVSLSRSGYELNVYGSVKNPNAFNVTLDSLQLKVIKNFGEGNVTQTVDLLSDQDLLPNASKSFEKTVTINSTLADSIAEVIANYNGEEHTVVVFPLPVIDPAAFLDPVTVTLRFDADTNECTITPVLSGPDYNVDVSLKITTGGTTKDYGSFVLSGSKTLESMSVGNGDVLLQVSGEYGINNLGVSFPIRYNAEFNCST